MEAERTGCPKIPAFAEASPSNAQAVKYPSQKVKRDRVRAGWLTLAAKKWPRRGPIVQAAAMAYEQLIRRVPVASWST